MHSLSDFQTPVDRQHFYFQFVTTPTSDTPGTTLILHFNNKRYLFGRVAEGIQRAFNERGISLKKSRNIFLTGETRWENNSGLLGMILTMSDIGAESAEDQGQPVAPLQIKILGGPKIWHSIACARRFIFRTGMPLRVYEADANDWKVSEQPDYYDENVLVWALPVQKQEKGQDTKLENGRSRSPDTIGREQKLRQDTVLNMFDSDWKKDKLYEAIFQEVSLPAMVWIRDPATKDLQATFCTKPEDAPHIQPDQKVFVRMPWPAALVEELPPADNLPGSVAMSYFIRGRPQRGAFMPQKAKELGVPFGPTFGILANGRSVTLDDGRVINPEDVMDAVMPGPGMAILDISHVDYLPDLRVKLTEMQDAGVLKDTHAFIWILGPDVLHSEEFTNFRNDFSNVKHVVSAMDDAQDYLSMQASAASATRLNQIRPAIFPVPKHNNGVSQYWGTAIDLIRADRGMTLHAAPKFEIAYNDVPEILDIEAKAQGVAETTKQLLPTDGSDVTESQYSDISISTLGTGSAMPSKYRNVSANLVHIPSLGYFLLDAGENTLGQLRRSYSPEELEHILCNLHMIWISHLHADHHLGTTSILVERTKVARKRQAAGQPLTHDLYLVSERNMADYLEEYRSIESNDAVLLKCLNSELTDVNGQPVQLKDTTLPISKLDTTRVSHCHGAQAVSVTFSNGFKISYSGDCRPSKQFAEIGVNSDVLIHEATFDDGMEGDAMAKKHCTIGEALGVAVAMKAKNVILTHFSQRYQKLPVLTNVKFPGQLNFEEGDDTGDADGPFEETSHNFASDTNGNTRQSTETTNGTNTPTLKGNTSLEAAAQEMSICIAFDLMRVTIPQIKDMYKYYPAIESMFEVEQMRSDERKAKVKEALEQVNKTKADATEAKRKANEMKKGDRPAKKKDKKKKPNGHNGREKVLDVEE